MSHTITHRYPVHIPWTTIIVVVVAALAAVAVLVIINRPSAVTDETAPVSLTAPGAVALPRLETHAEILALTGRAPGVLERPAPAAVPDTRHNFPAGTALGRVEATASQPAGPDTRHNFPEGTSLD